MLSSKWLLRYELLKNLNIKLLKPQCDRNEDENMDADDRGDYNSSPCTLYRLAKNDNEIKINPTRSGSYRQSKEKDHLLCENTKNLTILLHHKTEL